ncbi:MULTISPECIES: helix-turn-helix domain-containing protein [Microbacterium]|uniref:Helix-turn-helix domain-containing protein n=1 Tax=Microbacterium aurugineum TaxID=2851642 RepID=A0ABY4IVT5_9MICO|nr:MULTISPECIES: helix-turn-helix domain-containing protein [Microbacterium]PKQ36520.1 MAG: transcriptional regulator [Actinobacteria bacterium HGW-Actinobacteria-11]MCE0509991.1 helix-turn-helix domain-containing protein [Microbacterium sp. KKR3/1]MCK8478279.1 helix-turn-helix domain-containing protein [Microbacterium aurugineum]QEA27432.1 helix-turn-helix domain-containing protein [Microbacterium sp. CBA3102]TCJ23766.1 winged helix-turn-helix transcriptional regulator [Microbacterium sp. PI-
MANGGPVCGPISSYSRVQILHLLFEAGSSQTRAAVSIAELCEATGLHANTVREHLQRLIEGGYVIPTIEHRTTRGRPRTLYSAATGAPGASSPVARDKAKAAARRGDLMRSMLPDSAPDLGREATYQLDALVEHLEESGFEPVVDDRRLTVDLSPCPHAAGRSEDRPMLCRVHLELMQSVLNEAGGPLEAECVRDAVLASDCTVQLRDSTRQRQHRTGVVHGMA